MFFCGLPGDIDINIVQNVLILFLDSFPSDVPFRSGSGEGSLLDHDDEISRHDPFVEVSTRMELPDLANDVLLQLVDWQRAVISGFDEQGW
jgi:hypothetical protein